MSLSFMFPPRKLMQRLTGWVPTVDNKGLKKGEVAQVMFNGTPVYVLKTPEDKLFCYSAVCPHAACIVQWSTDDQHFKCPCHESVFDSLGNPSGGPATEPLTRLELKTDETGKIFIKLV